MRHLFLNVCQQIARHLGTKEILLLPEGTILDDAFYENITFKEAQKRAEEKFGPPDLDVLKFYSAEELTKLGNERVHYMERKVIYQAVSDIHGEKPKADRRAKP